MDKNTVMAVLTDEQTMIENLRDTSSAIFASFDCQTVEDRKKLYNATSGTGEPLKNSINKVINMVDVIVVPTEMKDKDGNANTVPRITIIDDKGTMYTAGSWGIYNCIKKINAIYGGLHFDDPLKITPIEVQTKGGSTMNLKIV